MLAGSHGTPTGFCQWEQPPGDFIPLLPLLPLGRHTTHTQAYLRQLEQLAQLAQWAGLSRTALPLDGRTAMPSSTDRFVTFHGGLTLPAEALRLAIDLELKGVSLTADGDHLVVRPRHLLTTDEQEAVRRWKWHLLALLAYEAPKPAWVQ